MKNIILKLRWLFILVLNMVFIAQSNAQNSSIDFLRSTGKIYTVVIVILIIFTGIIIYLYRIDSKLTKLENQIKNEQ